jgi:two-component system response regulator NreC
MSKITVVLADDHKMVREGLRALLGAERDLCVVGEAGDGVDLIRLSEQLKPDVVVVDLVMPGLSGLEVTRQLRHRCPGSVIVVLSMHANEAYVLEALRGGANGYVLKDSTASELIRAIREVARGRRYLSAPFSEKAIEWYLEKAREGPSDPFGSLTLREREVLQLVVQGFTSAEIARRLYISVRTVEVHRAHLMHKLNFRNQAELIRYAFVHGLVPLEGGATSADLLQRTNAP